MAKAIGLDVDTISAAEARMENDIPVEHSRWEAKYRAIYEAGCRFASQPEGGQHDHYLAFLEVQPRGRLIDFGCGEGHYAAMAAERGYKVLGVDAAPSAITRAREAHAGVEFMLADVCDLSGLPNASFELGVDLGCLHMFRDDDDAIRYLTEASRVLKPGAPLFLQERVSAEEAEAWFPHSELVPWWRERTTGDPPDMATSTYMGEGRTIEVTYPIIAAALRDLREHVTLLTRAGFAVEQARVVTPGVNAPFEAVLLARK